MVPFHSFIIFNLRIYCLLFQLCLYSYDGIFSCSCKIVLLFHSLTGVWLVGELSKNT